MKGPRGGSKRPLRTMDGRCRKVNGTLPLNPSFPGTVPNVISTCIHKTRVEDAFARHLFQRF